MTKYQKFRLDFERSGLTQRLYSEKIGCSASMVSQYLKKAREEQLTSTNNFMPIELDAVGSGMYIKITTSQGLTIEIPI